MTSLSPKQQMGGGVVGVPDSSGMMGNAMPVSNPTGMHSPQQQQQQMRQQQSIMSNLLSQQQQQSSNAAGNNNVMSLQTPTAPNAPQTAPPPTQQLGQPNHNQFNSVTLCKFAQETVQEIVCRFQVPNN